MESEYRLFKNLINLTTLDQKEIINIISKAECHQLNNHTKLESIISDKAEICFISNGVVGLFHDSYKNDLINVSLENEWVVFVEQSIFSTESETNSRFHDLHGFKFYHLALEKSTIYTFHSDEILTLSQQYPSFSTFVKYIYGSSLLNLILHLSQIKSLSAEEHYNMLLSSRSPILESLSQNYLATYLGILPSSLSRIKAQVSIKLKRR